MKIQFTTDTMDVLGSISREKGLSIAALVAGIVDQYVQQKRCSDERTKETKQGKEETNIIKL